MLGEKQIEAFDEQGYVMLDGWLTDDEVAELAAEMERLKIEERPQRLLEADSDLVRAIYAVHDLSESFGLLARDPRLVEPAKELLRSDVYIYQTQVNPKMPYRGNLWEWHQDFLAWSRDDGMPTSNVLSAGVFLDDVTEFNGPLFVIEGSQHVDLENRASTHGSGWKKTARDGNKFQIDGDTLSQLMKDGTLTSIKGRAGTVVLFHGGIVHCSPPNLSAQQRAMLFVRYNAMSNALRPVPDPRPEWVANRTPAVVEPLQTSFLTQLNAQRGHVDATAPH